MNKKKTLVFDLDDVVFDWVSHFLDYIREKFPSIPIGDADRRCCTKWEFLDKFQLSKEKQMEIYDKYCEDEMFIETPIFNRNIPNIINKLGEEYRIVFATARPKRSCKSSVIALRVHDIKFDKLYCLGGYIDDTMGGVVYEAKTNKIISLPSFNFKSDVFKKEKPLLVIDDNPTYLLEAYNEGVPSCLLMKRLHNKRWRRENPHYTLSTKEPRLYFVGPSWKNVEAIINSCLNQEISA